MTTMTDRRGSSPPAVVMVLWQLRYDLIGVVVVAAVMAATIDRFPLPSAAAVVPLMGVVVSIFIGFRNSNAFNRWWEARTLWSTVVGNCKAINNALTAVDEGSAEMESDLERMRRRQARHTWQLAAELRGVPISSAVAALTPEDPPDASASNLLTLQAAEIRDLVQADLLDRQGRSVLVNLNTAQAVAAAGLERIRRRPIPAYYAAFVRGLAWVFGILVCTRMDGGGHSGAAAIAVGALIMALFVVAERIGHFAEEPMSNTVFDIPMDQFCAEATADLLGNAHPLAASVSVRS